ncbi:hypothetical protein [Hymenobacter lucidus]|uniref:Uncharacterized protein n=1 Tax=Hymenobacter lucidus TaxID=2880930 RepID=A0ABS8ASF2_9BACT|nr:hypothetical protein [Hymenobacter lucidus]MCB2408543.1 hypothetical protein [Hymenobacter lucidus]
MLSALSLALATAALLGTSPAATPLPLAAAVVQKPVPAPLWQPLTATQARRLGLPRLRPQQYQTVRLNLAQLRQVLATVPAGPAGPVLQLPLPDGTLAQYQLRTTQVMAPELAARYPELQTYAGQEVGRPANSVRLEFTPTGLRAMLIRNGRTLFIEPYRLHDTQHYICFDKVSLPAGSKAGFETSAK